MKSGKIKLQVIFIAATVPFMVMTACHHTSNSSTSKADSVNAAKRDRGVVILSKDEAEFMVQAMDGGKLEVTLGKLAEHLSKNRRIKEFAAMMVRDHTNADNELKAIAKGKNITLPDSLSEDSKNVVQALSKKNEHDFDKAYMRAMLDGHLQTVNDFQRELKDAKDPDLITWLTNTLPVVQKHLDTAKSISKMYGNTGNMKFPPNPPIQ